MRSLGIVIIALALFGCEKSGGESKPKADQPVGSVGADGVRRVPIEVKDNGYRPDKIVAAPGEKLILVFTRTGKGHCMSQVHIADGPITDLPIGEPVELAVTAPEKGGTVTFACGMDMQTGVVAVN